MPVGSESHVGNVIVSASERPEEVRNIQKRQMKFQDTKRPRNLTKRSGSLYPIDPKVRNKTWISLELSFYANNEYVFVTPPIALALFWGKGEEICEPRSLTVIFFLRFRPTVLVQRPRIIIL